MNYNNAERVGWYVDDDSNYVEVYKYRGHEYKVYHDNEMPSIMQHQFEQQSIDLIVDGGEPDE